MRINTNVAALNAYRNLSDTNNAVAGSMQKLSSGFRINKAADDAAGLGIANRMRADTRAMTQASKNAEQANSVLQIAEGATSSIQKMLERMKELATQAGSDSVDVNGRSRINAEFTALKEEITRTVDTTKFQGGHLLKTVAASAGNAASVFNGSQSGTADSGNTGTATAPTFNGTYSGLVDATITVRVHDAAGANSGTIEADDFQASVDGGTTWVTLAQLATNTGVTVTPSAANAADGDVWTMAATAASGPTEASGGARSFLVGSSEQYTTSDTLTIAAIDLTLGATGLNLASAALTDLDASRAALTSIDAAMEKVATALGDIGATQNRVEFAQGNLKTTIQNFSAAESVIRDLDMAEEMTKFSKNNILAQAGTAMLAQANQSAQGVLQLLRG